MGSELATTHPTFTQVPPDLPCSIRRVLAPYQPAARLAAPLPPEPPPMTIKSYEFGVGAMALEVLLKCLCMLVSR